MVLTRPEPASDARIQLLNPALADQIAAGEVVERPASVIKETVENAIDAGATRVDVELEDGGLTSIRVVDNGAGIHPDDLLMAITRHGTSKIRAPEDLVDIVTLGFRGEALASMAAVARVTLRSRKAGAAVGAEIHSVPGETPRPVPVGMPVGTQIEIRGLFSNVPARRKFMRSEATEVGHCSETLLRLALIHPEVHLTLRHQKRELLSLPATTLAERVVHVLERRASGPFFALSGEEDGTRVDLWLADPKRAIQGRGGLYVVTRRRVVRERNLSQIVGQALGEHLQSGTSPIGALIVEPPPASVDVNVHPQKSEVRFSDPQRVYAAVRRILSRELERAPWVLAAAGAPRGEARGVGEAITRWAAGAPEPEAPTLRGVEPVEAGRGAGRGAGRATRSEVRGRDGSSIARDAPRGLPRAPIGFSLDDEDDPPRPGRRAGARAIEPEDEDQDQDEDQDEDQNENEDEDDEDEASARPRGVGRAVPGGDGEDVLEDRSDRPGLPGGRLQGASWPGIQGVPGDRSEGTALDPRLGGPLGPDDEDPDEAVRGDRSEGAGPSRGREGAGGEAEGARGYRLGTRALAGDYAAHKREIKAATTELRQAREVEVATRAPSDARPAIGPLFAGVPVPPRGLEDDDFDDEAIEDEDEADDAPGGADEVDARAPLPRLLTCLPGPVALFVEGEAVLAVDLRQLRSHLVYQRLLRDLRASKRLAVQGLLSPVVVRRIPDEVRLFVAAREEMLALGIDLDAFGEDAVLVRGVPAHLRGCLDDADLNDLIARVIPWLRLRAGDRAQVGPQQLLAAIAATRGPDPAPRLARRWIAELAQGGESLAAVPGVRRWTAAELLGAAP